MPSSPLLASMTSWPIPSNVCRSIDRKISSSSTIKIRAILLLPAAGPGQTRSTSLLQHFTNLLSQAVAARHVAQHSFFIDQIHRRNRVDAEILVHGVLPAASIAELRPFHF